jgi:4-carboxymuconolactone decarboxylase
MPACGNVELGRSENAGNSSNTIGTGFGLMSLSFRRALPSSTPKLSAMPVHRRWKRTMTQTQHQAQHQADERFERGLRALAEIDGHAGEKVVDALADIAPEFGRYLVEFPFGDIYSRPGLDLRSREIATIAALTAMGDATPQLKVHIEAGLHVGLSRDEIIEIVMQMAVYAGFPAALNGLFAAKEVFHTKAL